MTLPLRTPIRLLIFLAFAGVSLLALVYPRSVPAAPTITWEPSSISKEVGAGQSSTTLATFTVSENAKNVTLRVVPELAQYITVSPSTFASINKSVSYTVQLTFAPSATTTLGTYDGTIHIQQGSKTLAKPLPAQLRVVWPHTSLDNIGITISYPPTWGIRPQQATTIFSNVMEPSGLTETSLHTESFFEIRLKSGANPNALPIDQWFAQYFVAGFSSEILSKEFIVIDGHDAVRIMLSEIGGQRIHIYITNKTDVVAISYGVFEPQFIGDYESMVNNLHFYK